MAIEWNQVGKKQGGDIGNRIGNEITIDAKDLA